ncbi:MAG: response regulator [Ferruginibacter sp.]
MTNPIKILHLEDEENDADLVRMAVKSSNLSADIMVVDNKQSYIDALYKFSPDVILSDHSLPSFNSEEAFNIFLSTGRTIPFILVTANISEEYAVSIIKAGAHDYILKDRIELLPEAIVNSLKKIESDTNLVKEKELKVKEKTEAVIVAQEKERSHMGNELLENINQILAASNLYIDCAISDEAKRMDFMYNSKKFILMAIDEIKKLSQLIMPPTMGDIGLIDSLNNLIESARPPEQMNVITEWNSFNENTGDKLKLSIYRIVQEQLSNILKYAKANNAWLSLHQTPGLVELVIKDDGVGFDSTQKQKGVGLQNISTRAEMHDGKMLLESSPGKGCVLTVQFPV